MAKSHRNKAGIEYDSLKYDQIFIPDSAGYNWIFEDRVIVDTLEFEKAVVVATTDTFLSLPKYIRLWTTPIPKKLMVPNDTILVSGFIYSLLPSVDGKGYPILVTQLNYSSN
jgi:hypothetical protein